MSITNVTQYQLEIKSYHGALVE